MTASMTGVRKTAAEQGGRTRRGARPTAVRGGTWAAAALAVVLALAGCTGTPNRAPVVDRSSSRTLPVPPVAPPVEAKPLPGAENAGKPGYYTVRPGDTLIRIGLENGQNWRDIVRWNSLENPNIIEVGQVLRVVPPGVDPNAANTRGVVLPRVETRPLDTRTATGEPPPAAAGTPPAAAAGATPPAASGDDDIAWAWPAVGGVLTPFDDSRHKGLSIGGKAGDPVYAAADGRVVYAGSGLRGYGNLLILKHNATYLSAYAHNQTLLVKEDQAVRRGQKIAEMGSTDADRVQLHFEIRKQGKPIDPAKLLPPR